MCVDRALLSALLLAAGCRPVRPLPLPPIAQADAVPAEAEPSCVRAWPEARLRSYAYDHIVHLQSDCYRIASCNVSTNVNPTPIVVAIEPGQHLEVVTARGSETPEFTPTVQCSTGTR